LELTDRTDPAYNDAFFSLSAEVSETLGADDVDLVDIHTLSPRIGEAVFEQGLLLFGDPESVADLRTQVSAASNTAQSPRQRFDQALAKIDEHLGHAAATTADEHDHERLGLETGRSHRSVSIGFSLLSRRSRRASGHLLGNNSSVGRSTKVTPIPKISSNVDS
jgi:hypothetical protein